MCAKAQHAQNYLSLPGVLRKMREEAGMTQRELGAKLGKPQSWVHNCEVANRRVDVTEFVLWAKGCNLDPLEAFKRILKSL